VVVSHALEDKFKSIQDTSDWQRKFAKRIELLDGMIGAKVAKIPDNVLSGGMQSLDTNIISLAFRVYGLKADPFVEPKVLLPTAICEPLNSGSGMTGFIGNPSMCSTRSTSSLRQTSSFHRATARNMRAEFRPFSCASKPPPSTSPQNTCCRRPWPDRSTRPGRRLTRESGAASVTVITAIAEIDDVRGLALSSEKRTTRASRGGRPVVESRSDMHEWGNREKNTLVLNYTMQCPLRCSYCCYGCHPKRQEKMPFSFAESLVRQSGPFEDFTSLAFTGGEPLLFLDEVVQLAIVAQSFGKNTTIATAAHWAKTPSDTKYYIDRLVNAGLNRLNVSYDAAHAEFVPFDNIRNVAECAKSVGVPLYVVSTNYQGDGADYTGLHEPDQGVFHLQKAVAKVGRAAKLDLRSEISAELSKFTCYRRFYHDLVVFHDGKTYPCCSTFNRASPGLVIGNAFSDGFAEMRLRLLGSTLLRTIKRGSFERLLSRVDEYDPGLASIMKTLPISGGACSFCNSIFRNSEIYSRVYAAFERFDDALIESVLSKIPVSGGATAIPSHV
jgi:hypothetical protein